MAYKRDGLNDIINYIKALGISVNIGKNKARGNKGFFKAGKNSFRIDISKEISQGEILKILSHEFAHYIHFCEDNKMQSLDFIFENRDDKIEEQLIVLTVSNIPKRQVKPLFEIKKSITNDIKVLTQNLKQKYVSLSEIEHDLKKNTLFLTSPIKYFLKYDKFKYNNKVYSLNNIMSDFSNLEESFYDYIILQSKKRTLKRITSRISRLNRYYNSNSELFANSLELFITDNNKVKELAPDIYNCYEKFIANKQNEILNNYIKLVETFKG